VGSDGYIRQTPVINPDLYGECEEIYEGTSKVINLPSELSAKIKSPFKISIGDAVISYYGDVLMLDLSNGKSGYGRKIRKVRAGKINDIRIIADNSSIEIFAGDGRYIMSTRFYPAGQSISVVSEGAGYTLRTIGKMEVRGFD
jgi:beta-fructofuranosidase